MSCSIFLTGVYASVNAGTFATTGLTGTLAGTGAGLVGATGVARLNSPIIGTPKAGCFVCLEGIEHGNRFMSLHRLGNDPTKSAKGETWYRILGYADTHEEAMNILHPNPGDRERALNEYVRKTMLKMAGIIPLNSY